MHYVVVLLVVNMLPKSQRFTFARDGLDWSNYGILGSVKQK